MPDEYASRRDVEQLRDDVRATGAMASSVAVLATQMAQNTSAIALLRTDVMDKFTVHDKAHDKEEKERADDERRRTVNRHWLITTCIACLAAVGGLYGWLAVLLHK